jgi:hypothetical protein
MTSIKSNNIAVILYLQIGEPLPDHMWFAVVSDKRMPMWQSLMDWWSERAAPGAGRRGDGEHIA